MTPGTWPCPLPDGGTASEYALAFDRGREHRLLIVPALFDESNRMRRFTVEVMRRLDGAGIDCFLPDLPGCNESVRPLDGQSLTSWRHGLTAAAGHFRATHALGVRGGGLLMPANLAGWRYAPVKGGNLLRQLLRARVIAAREAGLSETTEALLAQGLTAGLELAGYGIGRDMIAELQTAAPMPSPNITDIPQETIGGAGLWLRAEPDENHEQADALAAALVVGLRS